MRLFLVLFVAIVVVFNAMTVDALFFRASSLFRNGDSNSDGSNSGELSPVERELLRALAKARLMRKLGIDNGILLNNAHVDSYYQPNLN